MLKVSDLEEIELKECPKTSSEKLQINSVASGDKCSDDNSCTL